MVHVCGGGQAIGGGASPRWYTAQSIYTAGARTFALTLYETTGGTFASAATVASTNAVDTATLNFASCQAATFTYNFTGERWASRSNRDHAYRPGADRLRLAV